MKRLLLLLSVVAACWAAPPVLFFTDITDGTSNGGENNNGSYVTIYGKNFGATRGASTVTVGGGAVAQYKIWGGTGYRSLEIVVIQLGASAVTGNIVMTVGGVASNALPFTVNAWSATQDRTFCVDSSGSDSNNGQFTTDTQVLPGTPGCLLTARKAKGVMTGVGDKTYFGAINLTWQSEINADNCSGGNSLGKNVLLSTTCSVGNKAHSGSSGHMQAFLGYPGATASIGGAGDTYPVYGLAAMGSPPQFWVVGEMSLVAGSCSLTGTTCTGHTATGGNAGFIGGNFGTSFKNWRLVGNEMECPFGDSTGNGCVGITINHTGAVEGDPTLVYLYGNRIRNYKAGVPTDHQGWRHSQAMYIGTDSNEIDVGWNEIDGSLGYGANGFHIHSSPTSGSADGYVMWGQHIHDNYIHDTPAGNDMSQNPAKGSGISWYNNIFAHIADCFDYPNAGNINVDDSGWNQGFRRSAMWSIGLAPTLDYNWTPISGTVQIFNNTFYDVGNCNGSGAAPGFLTMLNATNSSSAVSVKIPLPVTICASGCSLTQAGTLPATGLSPMYPPQDVGFQVTTSTIGTQIDAVLDDGNGNLIEWMKDGVELAPPGITVGTICYDTNNPTNPCTAGAYSFTLQGSPLNSTYVIKENTLSEAKFNFQNNIIYQLNNTTELYINSQGTAANSSLMLGNVFGDHNLFFTPGGQTVPPNFTSNIGSNSDPLFAKTPTAGAVPTDGDFHLQAGSPAVGAGTITAAARDFDGLLRVAPYSAGAFQLPTGGINMTPAPPPTTVGATYSYQATASGTNGACGTWVKSSGTFPPGVSISGTGLISGAVGGSASTFNFFLQCTDSAPQTFTSQQFSIVVNAVPAVTTASPLPQWTVNTAGYSQTFTNSGGTIPFAWDVSVGSVPAGMALSAAGALTGTPTGTGTTNFTARVTDNVSITATKAMSITINGAPSITTTSPLPAGTTTVAYSQTLAGTGGTTPYVWSIIAGALPAGLSLNASTGAITGTPTASCTPCTFTAKLTDAAGATTTTAFSLTINLNIGPPIVVSPSSAGGPAAVGQAFSLQMSASGGLGSPYTFAICQQVTAPCVAVTIPGLSLNTSTGLLSGTPTVPGTYNFAISATDTLPQTTAQQLTLVVLGGAIVTPLTVSGTVQ